ncbi:hypothetical protein EAS64_33720 [Trebonia kvetii]|uniref:Uncharacterized protein n=1 Tax=Trebonia kvetii TaxID=2480626 RepID=A0A6P2BQJ7_9ACTN|nr:hypothetical protein [Trebonia kvetii]TVZ01240.1 hypothetical protein EAS64_33720 [Trebonia kvetii]
MSDTLSRLKANVGTYYMVPDWVREEIKGDFETAYADGFTQGKAEFARTLAERVNQSDPVGEEITISLGGEVVNVETQKWYSVVRSDRSFLCAIIVDTDGLWWTKDEAEFEEWLNG